MTSLSKGRNLRGLATFGNNVKLFFKLRFINVKFNADYKYEKKNGVSRACFRDNQHLMSAHARDFVEKLAKTEAM